MYPNGETEEIVSGEVPDFSISIEDELTLSVIKTSLPAPYAEDLRVGARELLKDRRISLPAEGTEDIVEVALGPCQTVQELQRLQEGTLGFLDQRCPSGLALTRVAVTPFTRSEEIPVTAKDLYQRIAREFGPAFDRTVRGLHVHVCVQDPEERVWIFNRLPIWLGLMLCLSANSSIHFCDSGLQSLRNRRLRAMPKTTPLPFFENMQAVERFKERQVQRGFLDAERRKLYGPMILHETFPTIEFRIMDLPLLPIDSIRIAGLCQALVATLGEIYRSGEDGGIHIPDAFTNSELSWNPARYPLRDREQCTTLHFQSGKLVSMEQQLIDTLGFVDDVLDGLRSRDVVEGLGAKIDDPLATGADLQRAAWAKGGKAEVVELVMSPEYRYYTANANCFV